jgi:inorganic pyrophosphatase
VSYVLRRVIGYMVMEDEKGQDEKVACPSLCLCPFVKHERPLRTERGAVLCCGVVCCV